MIKFLFNLKNYWLTFVYAFIIVYFSSHAVYGSRGFISYINLSEELDKNHKKLEILKVDRVGLENKTKILNPSSLNKDILDEMARKYGFLSKNEKVLVKEKK